MMLKVVIKPFYSVSIYGASQTRIARGHNVGQIITH